MPLPQHGMPTDDVIRALHAKRDRDVLSACCAAARRSRAADRSTNYATLE